MSIIIYNYIQFYIILYNYIWNIFFRDIWKNPNLRIRWISTWIIHENLWIKYSRGNLAKYLRGYVEIILRRIDLKYRLNFYVDSSTVFEGIIHSIGNIDSTWIINVIRTWIPRACSHWERDVTNQNSGKKRDVVRKIVKIICGEIQYIHQHARTGRSFFDEQWVNL